MPDAYGGSVTVEPLPLAGRRVVLTPLQQSDINDLYLVEQSPAIGFRWRFRSGTPSPDAHARSMWDSVLATFIVRSRESGATAGLVSAYRPSMANGYVYLAALATPEFQGAAYVAEATTLFVNYIFESWSMRKIYIDTIDFNLPQFTSITRDLFYEEGRMREAEYHAGRYWDRIFLTLDRPVWEEHRERYMHLALPSGHRRSARPPRGGEMRLPDMRLPDLRGPR